MANDLTFCPSPGLASAPYIFWDGIGIGTAGSGIFEHAKQIYEACQYSQIFPMVVSSESTLPNADDNQVKDQDPFRDRRIIIPAPHPKSLQKFWNNRLIWPNRAGRFIEEEMLLATDQILRPIIYHGLANLNIPWFLGGSKRYKKVVTVHDIIPLLEPRAVSKAYYLQFKWGLPKILWAADAVVCVSRWTKDLLVERYPHSASKLVVIPKWRPRPEPAFPSIFGKR